MARMLLPAVVLALVLGVGGAWVIRGVVETTSDRLLDGSVLAIAERLSLDEDNEVTVDLPRAALGMLESQAQDRIFYSVTYDGGLVTGYRDLPRAEMSALRPGVMYHWNAVMRGAPVRVAAQARRLYGKSEPVLVQVAETRDARRALEFQLLGSLAALETILLGLVGVLAWLAIGRGLRPLTELSAEIGRRAAPGAVNLQPLDIARVPQEALAPVQAFNAMLQRMAESMGAMRRFTADASHQMGTPLTIMRMHLELIRRHHLKQPAPAEVSAGLDDVEGATQRLEHLLAQLLVLARADEEGTDSKLPLAPMDLVESVAEVVAERVPQALARGIEVQFEREASQIPVLGNPMLVREIIGNLMDNAIHYNREGGRVTVRVINDVAGPRAEIEDEGPGIPEPERAKVFERFHRVVRAGSPEGSGLGLAIVRTLADRIGAGVTLTNRLSNPGLLASVVFPTAVLA
jgi:two-component system sensor histidine kinase TctE